MPSRSIVRSDMWIEYRWARIILVCSGIFVVLGLYVALAMYAPRCEAHSKAGPVVGGTMSWRDASFALAVALALSHIKNAKMAID